MIKKTLTAIITAAALFGLNANALAFSDYVDDETSLFEWEVVSTHFWKKLPVT